MSKAIRKTEKTMAPPNCTQFERWMPADSEAAKQRLRAIAGRLQGSGRALADAPKKETSP